MTAAVLFKILIGMVLFAIICSLAFSVFFMINDKGQSTRMAKSLTVRVALSIALFVLLFIGFAAGLIKPHGLGPAQTEKALPAQRLPDAEK